jgi:hypothetical protein
MSYFDLLLDTFSIVWRHKFLWLFGTFAALSVNDFSNVRLSGTTAYAGDISRLGAASASDSSRFLLASSASILLGLVLLTFSFISQAGLIWATGQSLQKEAITLRDSLRQAARYLKPFLIVTLVLFGPLYVASLLLGPVLLSIDLTSQALLFLALTLGVVMVGIIITVVHQLAQRAIILQAQTARAGIAQGWQVFRRHTRQWIVTLICLLIVYLLYAAVMGAILVPLTQASVFPALFAWIQTGSISTSQMLSIVGVGAWALVLFAPMNAYQSIGMTLAYYRLNHLERAQPKQKKRRSARA